MAQRQVSVVQYIDFIHQRFRLNPTEWADIATLSYTGIIKFFQIYYFRCYN